MLERSQSLPLLPVCSPCLSWVSGHRLLHPRISFCSGTFSILHSLLSLCLPLSHPLPTLPFSGPRTSAALPPPDLATPLTISSPEFPSRPRAYSLSSLSLSFSASLVLASLSSFFSLNVSHSPLCSAFHVSSLLRSPFSCVPPFVLSLSFSQLVLSYSKMSGSLPESMKNLHLKELQLEQVSISQSLFDSPSWVLHFLHFSISVSRAHLHTHAHRHTRTHSHSHTERHRRNERAESRV